MQFIESKNLRAFILFLYFLSSANGSLVSLAVHDMQAFAGQKVCLFISTKNPYKRNSVLKSWVLPTIVFLSRLGYVRRLSGSPLGEKNVFLSFWKLHWIRNYNIIAALLNWKRNMISLLLASQHTNKNSIKVVLCFNAYTVPKIQWFLNVKAY